ncbi:MAG: glycoside hydrolase family 32 protein [Kiritimatiellaeota bacterium]|nr:glycoside hydrolase family 32 protein [Kiritimatiellota bacterium]
MATTTAGPGEDISCPYFWPIGKGKHLLLCFSHGRAGQGYLGTFDLGKARFTADYHFRANYGPWMHGSIHAPSATIDDRGRYLAIYNMKEGIGVKHEGWDGVMSLPLVYSLAKDNSLMVHPVKEIEKLRFGHKELAARPISSNKEEVFQGIGGKAVEIKAVLKPGTAREVGLKALQSPDGGEYTVIRFSADNKLSIDTSHSSELKNLKPRAPETGPLVLEKGEPLELRIFLDRSIVEVFANGRLFLGVRVYPTKEDAGGVSLFSTGGDAELVSLQAWQMRSVWPELKGKEGK